MRLSPSFRFLPLLLVTALGAGCADGDDDGPPKLVSVANQTGAAHRVMIGGTDFGQVPAGSTSDYREVADGELAVIVDGQVRMRETLASDDLGGSWTLYLQSASSNGPLVVGIGADD